MVEGSPARRANGAARAQKAGAKSRTGRIRRSFHFSNFSEAWGFLSRIALSPRRWITTRDLNVYNRDHLSKCPNWFSTPSQSRSTSRGTGYSRTAMPPRLQVRAPGRPSGAGR